MNIVKYIVRLFVKCQRQHSKTFITEIVTGIETGVNLS